MSPEEAGATTPSLAGQGLNQLAHEADANHRLLNLVPTPTWELGNSSGKKAEWSAGYSLSPATEVWAQPVRGADSGRHSRVVGVVGATSVGKSWLVGKLLEGAGAKPSRLEEHFDGVTLQSMTSDINLYTDSDNEVYYIDFEGTYGTQPLQMPEQEHREFMDRCPDPKVWEERRRLMLKDYFQPAIAYLTCNVVIFMTREKLVCRRSLEECEHFAQAANSRVLSALPPALVLIQNCCRPSEGIFKTPQCTEAFLRTHLGSDLLGWQKFFRSIDCFCIPDEYLTCKRSGFDGEEVCCQVLENLKQTLAARLEEDVAYRMQQQVKVSQVQWFSVLSALCRIVNERETVQMSSIYIRTSSVCDGLGELKSALLQLMTNASGKGGVQCKVSSGVSLIARFAVRRELSAEDLHRSLTYLMALYPCGAVGPNSVERFDGSKEPVVCGQMRLFHSNLHRSSALVRTVNADWIQGLGEWFRGGVTHAWPGAFACQCDFQEFDDLARVRAMVEQEIEEYKLERCLEGLSPEVGTPWVLRAHRSFRGCALRVRKDTSRMCVVCTAKSVDPGFFARMWLPLEGDHLPACEHCYKVMEQHDLCNLDSGVEASIEAWDQRCGSCAQRDTWPAFRRVEATELCPADHRVFPCKCAICRGCASAAVAADARATCPLCGQSLLRIVDERALLRTGWAVAVARRGATTVAVTAQGRSCGVPCSGPR